MSLVRVEDLVNYMSNIRLTAAQHSAAEIILKGLESEVASYLGRPLAAGEQTEEAFVGKDGFVRLSATPVTSIASVALNGDPVAPDGYRIVPGGMVLIVPYGAGVFGLDMLSSMYETRDEFAPTSLGVVVTYTGGLTQDKADQCKLEILRLAAKEMQPHHDDTLSLTGAQAKRATPPTPPPPGLDDLARNRLSRLRRRVAV